MSHPIKWVRCWSHIFLGCAVLLCIGVARAKAMEIDEAWTQMRAGKYESVLAVAEAQLKEREYSEEWRLLQADALLTIGKYPEAWEAVIGSIKRHPGSIRLRLVGREAALATGRRAIASKLLEEISQMASSRRYAYRDTANALTLGRAALLLGADPKAVLDQFFIPIKKGEPKNRDVYVAGGELALGKGDFALAAQWFREGLAVAPKDAELLTGLAAAFENGERGEMLANLEAALHANDRYYPAWQLVAEHKIDSEDYAGADEALDKLLKINPHHPEAWTLKAVLARLKSDAALEQTALKEALLYATNNPVVPHLFGKKLSHKYRFADGAKSQRQALEFDADYLPAKMQLGDDLLRLGEDEEGWKLVLAAADADAYDVTAYNLATLKTTVDRMTLATNEAFQVRMSTNEALIYGDLVVALLERARTNLVPKYGATLPVPVHVEIFPEQKDFAIRTFGLPGGEGYLGVCFGPVITANSPGGSVGRGSSWEAMLWHEFTHTITLGLTHNKMPRWISEGISVYEERLANPSWGERMTPAYRKMILKGDLKRIGELSSAFMAPPTPAHLQFAYYQSSLVVQYIVEKYGTPALLSILKALGEGVEINSALAQSTAPLPELEKAFADYILTKANEYGAKLDWKDAEPTDKPELVKVGWEQSNNNIVLRNAAAAAMDKKDWAGAEKILQRWLALHPGPEGMDHPWAWLARVERQLGHVEEETKLLTEWAERDSEAVEAYDRLIALALSREDWAEVKKQSLRAIGVNPLRWETHDQIARAEEQLKHPTEAAQSWARVVALRPPNIVAARYDWARMLLASGDSPGARQQVLEALEEAPRFKKAQELLLQLQ